MPFLQHARVQPFLDEPHDAPVRHAMLDEPHKPLVLQRVEGTYDTLPISRTCQSGSPSFVHTIHSKGDR
jgi:hypothetical protein